MKKHLALFALLFAVLVSCKDDNGTDPVAETYNYLPLKIGNLWTYYVYEIYNQTKEVNYLGTAEYEVVKKDSEATTVGYDLFYRTKMTWKEYGNTGYNAQMDLTYYSSKSQYRGGSTNTPVVYNFDAVGVYNYETLVSHIFIKEAPYYSVEYGGKLYKAIYDTASVIQSSCYYVSDIGITSLQYKMSNGNYLKFELKSHSLK